MLHIKPSSSSDLTPEKVENLVKELNQERHPGYNSVHYTRMVKKISYALVGIIVAHDNGFHSVPPLVAKRRLQRLSKAALELADRIE